MTHGPQTLPCFTVVLLLLDELVVDGPQVDQVACVELGHYDQPSLGQHALSPRDAT